MIDRKMGARGTSLMVYCSSTGGGVGSILGGELRSHMPRGMAKRWKQINKNGREPDSMNLKGVGFAFVLEVWSRSD